MDAGVLSKPLVKRVEKVRRHDNKARDSSLISVYRAYEIVTSNKPKLK